MSKSQNMLTLSSWAEASAGERTVPILEKQLMRTIELHWHVEQARIRLNGELTAKTRSLFVGMASELHSFTEMIRKRLESLKTREPHIMNADASLHWRLFPADSADLREQLESLLCGFAHYGRQTSEANTSLQGLGDTESSQLLGAIFNAVERSLWFIEIYLEGLALNADSSRLPDWSGHYVNLRK